MNIRNFRLENPSYAIGLEGLGRYWDLHAFARLTKLQYFMRKQIAELHWVAPSIDNPWGDKGNVALGCLLRFENVTAVLLSNGTIGDGEECVASISKVRTVADLCEEWKFRVTESLAADGDFGLLFELENERTIEIHSGSAELFAI